MQRYWLLKHESAPTSKRISNKESSRLWYATLLIIETQKCPNVVDAYLTIDRNLWHKQFKLSRVSNYFAEKIDK